MNDSDSQECSAQKHPGTTQKKGMAAESAVAQLLERKGFTIIARNYRALRLGELDLVARKNDKIVIVEVKARSHPDSYGGPAAAITRSKRVKMRRTASYFLKEKQLLNNEIYFLAGLVRLDNSGKPVQICFEPVEWL